jgi:hypothetical protein
LTRKRNKKNEAVVFGKSSLENSPKNRRRKMNSENTREVTFNISMSNIEAAVETHCLRALTGYVKDNEVVPNMIFGEPVNGFDQDGKPTVVVPVQCTIKEVSKVN